MYTRMVPSLHDVPGRQMKGSAPSTGGKNPKPTGAKKPSKKAKGKGSPKK